jgi:hypothetical protein
LFTWFPEKDFVANAITGQPENQTKKQGRPIGEHVIAGMAWTPDGLPFYFDYATGSTAWKHEKEFPEMPEYVREATPMSLWNLALEVHTTRIYGAIIGDFYILLIPLAGLSLLLILITGLWMYLKKFRNRKSSKPQPDQS